jgi:hypothetical protein
MCFFFLFLMFWVNWPRLNRSNNKEKLIEFPVSISIGPGITDGHLHFVHDCSRPESKPPRRPRDRTWGHCDMGPSGVEGKQKKRVVKKREQRQKTAARVNEGR